MESFVMSKRERKRLEVFSQVKSGKLTLAKASELLALGYRQVKRIWRRYMIQSRAPTGHGASCIRL